MKTLTIYMQFKICLLLKDKSIKEFADEYTGTTAQHVTMVAQGKKDSKVVLEAVYAFVESVLGERQVEELLGELHSKSSAINGGARMIRETEMEGEEYDW